MADMVLAPDQGDYGLDWQCGKASDAVIPGRCEASNPESRDSGSGAKAPSRNDGVGMLVAMTSRPPDLLAAIHLSLSARERAAVLFLGGGDHFQVLVGARDRRARGEDVPLILDLVGGQGRDPIHFLHQLMIGGAEVTLPRLQNIEFCAFFQVVYDFLPFRPFLFF